MTGLTGDDPESTYQRAGTLQEAGNDVEAEITSRHAAEQSHRQAASCGDSVAACELARMFVENGRDTDAIPYYRQAATAGDTLAMTQLAHLLSRQGPTAPPADLREAEKWLRKALADRAKLTGFSAMSALSGIVAVLLAQGRSDDAEPFMQQLERLQNDPGVRW